MKDLWGSLWTGVHKLPQRSRPHGIVWSQVTADILTVALSAFVYFSFRRKLVDGGELR